MPFLRLSPIVYFTPSPPKDSYSVLPNLISLFIMEVEACVKLTDIDRASYIGQLHAPHQQSAYMFKRLLPGLFDLISLKG